MINEFKGKYFFLSNMYNAPVTYQGINYLNNEAAYQSCKLIQKDLRSTYSTMDSSTALINGQKLPLRPDWEKVKKQVINELVMAKFKQNDFILKKLLKTGDEVLIERNDKFVIQQCNCICNRCISNPECNELGKALMLTRSILREVSNNGNVYRN